MTNTSGNLRLYVALLLVFAGCGANLYTLEHIVIDEFGKGFGATLTLLQFITVSALSFLLNINRLFCHFFLNVSSDRPSHKRNGSQELPFNMLIGVKSHSGAVHAPFLVPLRLPYRKLILLSFTFWLNSVVTNSLFQFNISVPLMTVFRSSGLLVSMAFGWWFSGRRYQTKQIGCAILVAAGSGSLSLLNALDKKGHGVMAVSTPGSDSNNTASEEAFEPHPEFSWSTFFTPEMTWYCIGVCLMTFTLVASAGLGLIQDMCYSYGKQNIDKTVSADGQIHQLVLVDDSATHRSRTSGKNATAQEDHGAQKELFGTLPMWPEAVFYSHCLAIPLFLLAQPPAKLVNDLTHIPPHLVHYIFLNMVTQFVCIMSVYQLTEVTSSFILNFTLTVRKFLSLMFSILYFEHYKNFTYHHFLAIAAAMLGGALYPILSSGTSTASVSKSHGKAARSTSAARRTSRQRSSSRSRRRSVSKPKKQ